MRQLRRYSLFLLLLTLTLSVSSQSVSKMDSVFLSQLRETAVRNYYAGLKANLPFYSGAEYTGHGQGIQGHPFYPDDLVLTGNLYYDGILYPDIPLQYDLVDDAVIIMDYTRSYFIKLNSQKVDSFTIGDRKFVRPGRNESGEVDNSLYEQLHHGSIRILVRREKKVLYRTTTERTIASYKQYNTFFIIKNGDWHGINSTDQAIRVLKEKKNELKQLAKDNNWRFSKESEKLLTAFAHLYETHKP